MLSCRLYRVHSLRRHPESRIQSNCFRKVAMKYMFIRSSMLMGNCMLQGERKGRKFGQTRVGNPSTKLLMIRDAGNLLCAIVVRGIILQRAQTTRGCEDPTGIAIGTMHASLGSKNGIILSRMRSANRDSAYGGYGSSDGAVLHGGDGLRSHGGVPNIQCSGRICWCWLRRPWILVASACQLAKAMEILMIVPWLRNPWSRWHWPHDVSQNWLCFSHSLPVWSDSCMEAQWHLVALSPSVRFGIRGWHACGLP